MNHQDNSRDPARQGTGNRPISSTMAGKRKASPDDRKKLGDTGEEIAARFLLEERSMRLLARNWRARSGEIDIVAEDGETLVFVEVRTRRSTARFGLPEESVDFRKQRQVRDTALLYLHTVSGHGRKIRFDVVAVIMPRDGGEPEIRHIPFAF